MADQWLFIVKLFVLSAVLAAAIKYLAPLLPLPATSGVALTFVLTPTLVLAAMLAWRQWQFEKQQKL